jgi:HTH-type transcriptional regulator/antitoxin MqsA
MSGEWHEKSCPVCDIGTLHDRVVPIETVYRGKIFRDKEVGAICDNCGDGVMYYDADRESRWKEFRRATEGAEPKEMARIRRSLHLTQDATEKLIGGGHNAVSRYETGAAKPSLAAVNLLRAIELEPRLLSALQGHEKILHDALAIQHTFAASSYSVANLAVSEMELHLALVPTNIRWAQNSGKTDYVETAMIRDVRCASG